MELLITRPNRLLSTTWTRPGPRKHLGVVTLPRRPLESGRGISSRQSVFGPFMCISLVRNRVGLLMRLTILADIIWAVARLVTGSGV